jgi:hypothetical protein
MLAWAVLTAKRMEVEAAMEALALPAAFREGRGRPEAERMASLTHKVEQAEQVVLPAPPAFLKAMAAAAAVVIKAAEEAVVSPRQETAAVVEAVVESVAEVVVHF